MKHFEFTLGFGIMANDELDARVKLADLLKSISKDDILQAMHLEDPDRLTGDDASELLDALDNFVESVDQNVSGDFSRDIDQSLWDDYGNAMDVLRFYQRREPPNIYPKLKGI